MELEATQAKLRTIDDEYQTEISHLRQDKKELLVKHKNLETDRNNVLLQTKRLMNERTQWSGIEDRYQALVNDYELAVSQLEKLKKPPPW